MCCFLTENLQFNTKEQCAKCLKKVLTGKKVLEKEGLEIGHLRGNLASGHITCVYDILMTKFIACIVDIVDFLDKLEVKKTLTNT